MTILLSNLIENKELQQQVVTSNEELLNHLFLRTSSEDMVLVFFGLLVTIVYRWSRDSKKFEVRVKDTKNLSSHSFKKKYSYDKKKHKGIDWNWKLWWKENDQDFVIWMSFSLFLVISLPFGWDELVKPNFDIFGNTNYNPFISALIGFFSRNIVNVIINREDKIFK